MRRWFLPRCACLLACLTLAACSARAPAPTPEAAGSEICRTGTFFRVVGDPVEGREARIHYRLRHAQGTAELSITPQVLAQGGGMLALGRAQVEVRGTVEATNPERIRVATVTRVTEGVTPCS